MKTLKLNKKPFILFCLSIVVLMLLLTKCTIISFYPLYTEKELVNEDKILGKWMSRLVKEETTSDSIIWEIGFDEKRWKKKNNHHADKESKQIESKKTYTLKLYPATQPNQFAEFNIHIVKLNNQLYLDFLLEEMETEFLFTVIHLLPVHTFAKLNIGEELTVQWFDANFLEKLVKEDQIKIRYEKRKDALLLTAKPAELQKFIIEYSDNEEAYLENLSFVLTAIK